MDIKELVIDRSRWGRGATSAGMLRALGGTCLCCLGFLGEQCGASDKALAALYPVKDGVSGGFGDPNWPEWLFENVGGDYERRHALGSINDNGSLSEEERETRLTEEFAKHGVAVRFVGTGAP